jgi:hypothetical protein
MITHCPGPLFAGASETEHVMKQQKNTKPSRPDPNAKNEPAKRIPTSGRDDVRQANEEGTGRNPKRAHDAQVRQSSDDDVRDASEEA